MIVPEPSSDSDPWKALRRKARAGTIAADDVTSVLNVPGTAAARVSRLRFALRLKRWVEAGDGAWLLDRDLERDIATIYRDQHDRSDDPAAKLRYARWAKRYGMSDFDWPGLYDRFRVSVERERSLVAKLIRLREADAAVAFDQRAGIAQVHVEGLPRFDIEARALTQVVVERGLVRQPAAAAAEEWGEWRIALRTDAGPKPPNQDATLFAAFADDSYLAAVADGTGDSHDGARAADVALRSLRDCLAVTGDLRVAAEYAATTVRADNLARSEENACTLVALHVRNARATLIQLSDPFHWMEQEDGSRSWSRVAKTGRANVGGEPLGDTLTSGGNAVRTFTAFVDLDASASKEVDHVRAFVLGSDGLLPSETAVRPEDGPPVCVDFGAHGNDPSRVAAHCCRAARAAMDAEARGPDNITCVAGSRNR